MPITIDITPITVRRQKVTSRFEFIMSPAGVLTALRAHRVIRTVKTANGGTEPTRAIPAGFVDVPISMVPQTLIDRLVNLEYVVDSLDSVIQ